jgi:hypothetical protein
MYAALASALLHRECPFLPREETFVKRLMPLAAVATAALVQGCATSTPSQLSAGTASSFDAAPDAPKVSAVALGQAGQPAVHGAEIGVAKDAPIAEGHPLTSVVVTQCNLVVAVYMTMPDGRLLRFDRQSDIPAEQLVSIAYTATRSERVEVSCEDTGVAGYETHGPV